MFLANSHRTRGFFTILASWGVEAVAILPIMSRLAFGLARLLTMVFLLSQSGALYALVAGTFQPSAHRVWRRAKRCGDGVLPVL